ncbi:GNAT family N-acetyltransferase [Methanobacterium oryzae]|uniref:GNAT family N-acetyltransferase n=1 Tax=Methanobacterium oryzae TaxID=69540 RepID=UPI003D2021FF
MDDISNKVEYLKLSANNLEELIKLIKLYENVFQMEPFQYPSHDYLEKILKNENTIFVVAKYEEEIIGGLTAHELASTYFEVNEVYVYDLAVRQDFQRKGIGTRLIDKLKKFSCSKGDKEIFLQADIGDDYAIDFYKKIGGVPEDVIHFSFACKENKKK